MRFTLTLIRHRDHAITNRVLAIVFDEIKDITRSARTTDKFAGYPQVERSVVIHDLHVERAASRHLCERLSDLSLGRPVGARLRHGRATRVEQHLPDIGAAVECACSQVAGREEARARHDVLVVRSQKIGSILAEHYAEPDRLRTAPGDLPRNMSAAVREPTHTPLRLARSSEAWQLHVELGLGLGLGLGPGLGLD